MRIYIGDGDERRFDDLKLMPNQTMILTVSCPVGNTVEDMEYVVSATFRNDNNGTTSECGMLYLDIPGVGISSLTLTEAPVGNRTLRFSLYNQFTAPLWAGRDTVQAAFCSDPAHTEILKDGSGDELTLTISDAAELALINSGGCSKQVSVDTIKAPGTDAEIPNGGFPVFAMVWIEQDDGIISEYHTSNNYKQLTCQSLPEQYGGDPVHIESSLYNGDEKEAVRVSIQNNSLLQKATGNITVTLPDSKDEVPEQQNYTGEGGNNGLITLEKEQKVATSPFTFSKQGASARVACSDAVLTDDANASLASVTLDGVAPTYDEATRTYSGSSNELSSALQAVVPEDLRASVTANGAAYHIAVKQFLSDGKNTVTITVKPDEGYELGSLTITDGNGNAVKFTDKGDGKFTFTMPHSNVEINASFAKEGTVSASPFVDVCKSAYCYDAVQ